MAHRAHLPPVRIAALIAVIAGGAIAMPAAATDRVVVVQPGDTLSEIALQYGLTVAQLREFNGIADPNRIYAGQRLRLTGTAAPAAPSPPIAPTPPAPTPAAAPQVHVVVWGETLTGIARRYGSSVAAIAAANGIANPSYVRAGQKLSIPGTSSPAAPSAPPAPAAAAAPPPAATPQVHVVARGETLTGIARRYGSSIAAIAAANGIANPSYVRAGRVLSIPGASAPAPAAATLPSEMAALVAARAKIGAIIRSEAEAQGVPVAFALAVAWHESGWRAGVVSQAGAVGVMQITPPTADWVASTMLGHGIELYDARSNVQAGVTLLKHYLDRYHGDRSLVLAAYYQGQTAADRYGIYRMTRPYIASILALESFFSS
jgi:LysM repeat protein